MMIGDPMMTLWTCWIARHWHGKAMRRDSPPCPFVAWQSRRSIQYNMYNITDWWFGTWLLWLSIQLGISSSQLTFTPSFFRGLAATTNQIIMCSNSFIGMNSMKFQAEMTHDQLPHLRVPLDQKQVQMAKWTTSPSIRALCCLDRNREELGISSWDQSKPKRMGDKFSHHRFSLWLFVAYPWFFDGP